MLDFGNDDLPSTNFLVPKTENKRIQSQTYTTSPIELLYGKNFNGTATSNETESTEITAKKIEEFSFNCRPSKPTSSLSNEKTQSKN